MKLTIDSFIQKSKTGKIKQMLKRNLFYIFSLFVIGLASFVICINNYNPFEASAQQFIFFYTSFFVTSLSLSSIIIFYLKVFKAKGEIIYNLFWPSVRQGLFFSIAATSLLILKGMNLIDIWVSLPVIIIVVLLELFFQTKRHK